MYYGSSKRKGEIEKRTENLFEGKNVKKNFPNLRKDKDIRFKHYNQAVKRENHEMSKRKVTHLIQQSSHKMGFSAKTLQARRVWDNIFKGLKLKNCQPRILY